MSELGSWQGRWQAGQTGWDLGGAHPRLERLVAEAKEWGFLPPGARVLEPGCGRAHNGAALARMGYDVVAFDLVQEAIDAARAVYADVPRLELCVRDALVTHDDWRGGFDAIFDRAVLCAVQPEARRPYLKACFDHLKPGGVFMTLPFTETSLEPGKLGPPFAIPMSELTRLATPGFQLLTADEQRVDDGRIVKELACLWRRRDRWLVESD